MRRLLTVAALVACVAGAAAVADAQSPAPAGTAVGVAVDEFTITPYRRSVPPGLVRFNIENLGEDGHNLVVVGPKGSRKGASPEVEAGGLYTLPVKLKRPGRYRLICTAADHLERGMSSRLRVRAPQ